MTDLAEFNNPEIINPTLSAAELQKIIAFQRKILARAVISNDYQTLFEEICSLAESFTPNAVATIMLYSPAEEVLHIECGPGLSDDAKQAFAGLRSGDGSCGNAVFHNEPMYVSNTFKDARWKNVVHVARQYNICSCFAFPIRDEKGCAIGSFAISSFEHRAPEGFHQALLETCASIVGVLLQRRSDQEVRDRFLYEQEKSKKLTALGVLAGGIAHDFNNLLASTLGYVDLAHAAAEEGQVKNHLDWALRAIDRARLLTNQLLTFSKGGTPVKKMTDVVALANESATLALHGTNISFALENTEGQTFVLEVDDLQIGQIFQNLLVNAKQAMPSGGEVRIGFAGVQVQGDETIADGSYLRIDVIDQGPGVSQEIQDLIFDPYFTTKSTGHGLGLATCFSIARSHGGKISVETPSSGGSCFSLYLPWSDPSNSSHQSASDISQDRPRSRILAMDDNDLVRGSLSGMLGNLGFDVCLAADGAEALEIIDQSGVDSFAAFLLDMSVPDGMGGIETAKRIHDLNSEARIIVISGYSDDQVMANYRDYGFCAALAKPFRSADLGQSLEDVLKTQTEA